MNQKVKEGLALKIVKRFTIPVPMAMEQRVTQLRKTDAFCRATYAEILRELLLLGLDQFEKEL
jgi:hypothetical protein